MLHCCQLVVSVVISTLFVHVCLQLLAHPLLQDSEVFSSVDASEYICDLWRNPDHLTKENLAKFEDVSLMCDADHECRPNNHTISSTCMVWHFSLVIMHHLEGHMTQS